MLFVIPAFIKKALDATNNGAIVIVIEQFNVTA
jgi:hypothetical protein